MTQGGDETSEPNVYASWDLGARSTYHKQTGRSQWASRASFHTRVTVTHDDDQKNESRNLSRIEWKWVCWTDHSGFMGAILHKDQ